MSVSSAVPGSTTAVRRRPLMVPFVLAVLVAAVGWLAPGVARAGAAPNGGPGTVADDPPITPGSGWQTFTFDGVNSFDFEGPFTFTSGTPAVVSVTDAFCRGDQFRVYDNAVPIGDTSPVPVDTACSPSVGNADAAFHDPAYSKGSFLVPAGPHSITIQAIVSPFGSGGAYLRVDACTVFGAGDLVGTAGNDVICGSAGPDRIAALDGDDLIFTFGGDDQIAAGGGNDTVYAGAGADRIAGDAGTDALDGQEGNDLISGGDGTDTAYGGDGTDTCVAETRLYCEA